MNEMDEPRACYIEWSKSAREKQILHINICIWNLERYYWWTYLQGSNKGADIVNRFLDTVGEWKGGANRATLKLIHYCKTTAAATAAKSRQSCPSLCDPMDGSPPGPAVPGVLQARVLEWGAIAFSHIYSQACLNHWLLATFGMPMPTHP